MTPQPAKPTLPLQLSWGSAGSSALWGLFFTTIITPGASSYCLLYSDVKRECLQGTVRVGEGHKGAQGGTRGSGVLVCGVG